MFLRNLPANAASSYNPPSKNPQYRTSSEGQVKDLRSSRIQFDGLTIELQQTARSIDGLVHFPAAFNRPPIATRSIWYELLPQNVRHNARFKVEAWQREHPRTKAADLASRLVDLHLQAMQREHGSQSASPLDTPMASKPQFKNYYQVDRKTNPLDDPT